MGGASVQWDLHPECALQAYFSGVAGLEGAGRKFPREGEPGREAAREGGGGRK